MARALTSLALLLALAAAGPATARERLVLMEPEIEGDLAVADAADDWRRRLELIAHHVAGGLGKSGTFQIADPAAAEAELAKHRRRNSVYSCVPCGQSVAEAAGADKVLSLRVFRMSQLVLSMQAIVRDRETGATVYSRAADFRGDTDEAWLRAADYLLRHMRTAFATTNKTR